LEKNSDLEREKTDSLKESQCDIIAYLSRQVEMKNNEIIDLDNTISTLKSVGLELLLTVYGFVFRFLIIKKRDCGVDAFPNKYTLH